MVMSEPGEDMPRWNPRDVYLQLAKVGWYWGSLTHDQAASKLEGQEDGTFLLRDSSQDCHLFTLTFRTVGQTWHIRIQHCKSGFYIENWSIDRMYLSVVDLIEDLMRICTRGSATNDLGLAMSSDPNGGAVPFLLTKPMSRFDSVQSLQHLCRFVIRLNTRIDHIRELPLPDRVKDWISETSYLQGETV